jgi:hypothetical protein
VTIKIQVATAVATVKALEDRWSLKAVSDADAKIVWTWLYENEPGLADKIQKLGSAQAAAEWRNKIMEALYK